MECNSIIDFSKIQNTGSNMTAVFTWELIDELRLSIGLTDSNATFFAASDVTNEVVAVSSEFIDGMISIAIWGSDFSEKDINRSFVGLEEGELFSIFVMVRLNIYQISTPMSYSQNGFLIMRQGEDLLEVCYTAPSEYNYSQLEQQIISLNENATLWYDLYMADLPKINAYDRLKEDNEEIREAYLNSYSAEQYLADIGVKNDEITKLKEELRDNILSLGLSDSGNEVLRQQSEDKGVKITQLNDEITKLNEELKDNILSLGLSDSGNEVLRQQSEDKGVKITQLNDEITKLNEEINDNILSLGLSDNSNEVLRQQLEDKGVKITQLNDEIKSIQQQIEDIIPEDGITQDDLDVLNIKIEALESYKAQMVNENDGLSNGLIGKNLFTGLSLVALLFLTIGRK